MDLFAVVVVKDKHILFNMQIIGVRKHVGLLDPTSEEKIPGEHSLLDFIRFLLVVVVCP